MTNSRNIQIFQVLISMFILTLSFLFYITNYTQSLEIYPYLFITFILFLIISNHVIAKIYYSSTYGLFLITFMLFIGGRFISYILDPTKNIFTLDFFAHYTLNEAQSLKLMTFILIGIAMIDLGYKLTTISKITLPNYKIHHNYIKKIALLAIILSPSWVIDIILNIKNNLNITGGYLESKVWQTKNYNFPLASLAQTIFSLSFGYSVIFNYKKKTFLLLFTIMVLGGTMIGARGPIFSAIFLYIWYLGRNGKKRLSFILAPFIVSILVLFILYFIQTFSLRANNDFLNSGLTDFIADFFYNQGISLMVFDVSMKIENYPLLAYFQTILPGSSAIAALFTEINYSSTGFQHYLAKELDSYLFKEGYGLDWTLFSDFFVFGGKTLIGFSMLSFLFGSFIALLQNSSKHCFWYILLFSIITRIIFLHRSSLSTLLPFIIYFMVFYYFIPRIRLRS